MELIRPYGQINESKEGIIEFCDLHDQLTCILIDPNHLTPHEKTHQLPLLHHHPVAFGRNSWLDSCSSLPFQTVTQFFPDHTGNSVDGNRDRS